MTCSSTLQRSARSIATSNVQHQHVAPHATQEVETRLRTPAEPSSPSVDEQTEAAAAPAPEAPPKPQEAESGDGGTGSGAVEVGERVDVPAADPLALIKSNDEDNVPALSGEKDAAPANALDPYMQARRPPRSLWIAKVIACLHHLI